MAEVPIDQEKTVDGEEKLADEDESQADSFLSHQGQGGGVADKDQDTHGAYNLSI